MPQYSDGRVIIKTSNKRMIVGINTLFEVNVSKGSIFILDEDPIPYVVDIVLSDTEFLITTEYRGRLENIISKYSVLSTFSGLFDIPLIVSNDKSFPALSSLSLRMFDSVFKNLGFVNPNDPICVSSNSLKVKIYPQKAVDAQARWKLNSSPELYISGKTLKGLPIGRNSIVFSEISSFISPLDIPIIMEQSSNRIVIGRYTLIGIHVPVVVEIMVCWPEVNIFLKRVPPPTVIATVINGEGLVDQTPKIIKYRTQAVFDVTGGFKISSNTDNVITGGTVSAVYNGSTITTDTMYEDGTIIVKPLALSTSEMQNTGGCTKSSSIQSSVIKTAIQNFDQSESDSNSGCPVSSSIQSSVIKTAIQINEQIECNDNGSIFGSGICSATIKSSIIIP